MGLYRRGPIWWVAFYTPTGRVVESTGTANRKDAEIIHDELKRRANAQRRGIALPARKLTFAQLAATFLQHTGNHRYHVERLKALLPHFGSFQVSAISRSLVDAYRTQRLTSVSGATVNRDVAVLRRILYWALDEGWLSFNPLTRYRRLREPKRPRRVLSVTEERPLLEAALPHVQLAIILALDTGMRRGEILTLQREHLDPYRKVLTVSQSKTEEGAGREIPWTNRVEALLTRMAGGQGCVVLFRGSAFKNLKKGWRRALKNSRIPPLRFHDLRHTFNTRLMEAGVSQDIRKALMGHADSDINDTYTHVELPAKRAAISALDRWVHAQRAQSHHADPTTEGGHHGTLASSDTEGNDGGPTRTPQSTH